MASISTDKKTGLRRILFFNADGERKQIRLGKATSLDQARTTKTRIELLIAAKINGTAPDDDTSRWVASRGDTLHAKLAEHGLVSPRVKIDAGTLATFLDAYIAGRSDVKSSTATVYGHTRRCLVEYFGAGKPIAEITLADADDWRRWLLRPANKDKSADGGQGLAENTARRRCGIAKQFFRTAVRRRLIAENPFADMKGVGVLANRTRDYFVSRAEADKVIAACPDAQWKLLFALSRYGGLRCPSEHLSLRWGDVDWKRGRIVVRSPKTEHHEGKASRMIPLFPELRPHLQAVLDELLEDFDPKLHKLSEQPVITRYRDHNANLRTQLLRIIWAAGVKEWPKLFQNLRSTRETELAEQFPMHVVCEWIGNSQAVAAKHYLQTTDSHFAEAAGNAQNAAQNPAQSAVESDDNACQRSPEALLTPVFSSAVNSSQLLYIDSVGDEGLEPPTFAV